MVPKPIPTMSNILEEGENIEVNFDEAALGLTSESVEKEAKRSPSRRFLPFSFRRTSAVSEDRSSPPAAIAIPSPSSSCHDDDEEDDDEVEIDEEPRMHSNKTKTHERTRSYIYEEEPELLHTSSEYDDQSLAQAETLENLLGSAVRLAEEGTGENFLALSRVSRDDAIELGRRVSTFSDIRAMVAPTAPPLLQDDDASVHTANTHATETSFIKVPPMDPASIPQDFWTGIMRMMSLDTDDNEVTLPVITKPEEEASTQASSTPPESKGSEEQPNLEPAAPSPPRTRKWDKLRNTFVAQENGLSVGHEAQADPQLPKTKTSPPRKPILGKAPRKSVASKERSIKAKNKASDKEDFCMALGPVPQQRTAPDAALQTEERVFDVNIRVEDLSKEHDEQYSYNSFDSSADSGSDDDDSGSYETDETPPVQPSFDHEEAESMEVVYLLPDDSTKKGDVLPPFPSKIFGVPAES